MNALQRGNAAFRKGDYREAIAHFGTALADTPALARVIAPNIARARDRYRAERKATIAGADGILRVGVSGWELAHNAAGRAYTLALLYRGFADAELIGPLYADLGREVWEPIRATPLPKHTFLVEDPADFISQALTFVAEHPYDLVHLSKPRAPNLFIGLLYKLIWGAAVLMDVDDEELAFVGATLPATLAEYEAPKRPLPPMADLLGREWTRLSVGVATAFDGVTVPNTALQARYGGTLIAHARDERQFRPTPAGRQLSRLKQGIPGSRKVVLFFGTPRAHKGLLQVAQAIAGLGRPDVTFVIVGDFVDPDLKPRLLSITGVDYHFIGNQPFSSIPEVVALADVCVLYQDPDSLASQYQTPAKLGDALAMGVPVIASPTPGLADAIDAGAITAATDAQLRETLAALLEAPAFRAERSAKGRAYYLDALSFASNQPPLRTCAEGAAGARGLNAALTAIVDAVGDPRLGALTERSA